MLCRGSRIRTENLGSVDAFLANQLNAIATAGVLNSIAQKREQQVVSLETSYQASNSDKEGLSTTK